ncbi:hypothetical protein ZWY2020_037361 [Hordeum vulgare]|nr:hypothetical protein ZWY2020_037361 [Hordeum vulgare]
MGVFMRGSLNPPAQPPAVVDDEGNPPPASCIIDRVAYITDVTNASIAGYLSMQCASSGWRQDSEVVHGSEVGSTIDPALLELPPYEFDVDKGLPLPQIFEKHYTSLPVISLHDDGKDVVYFMAKVNYHKPALVTAVDMSNKTAQQATQFLPGKLMETAFVHSRISRFLSMAPASRLGYYKRKLESTSNGMDVPMNDTLMM